MIEKIKQVELLTDQLYGKYTSDDQRPNLALVHSLPITEEHPLVLAFARMCSTNLEIWDFSLFNEQVPTLSINHQYYQMLRDGYHKLVSGERGKYSVTSNEISVMNANNCKTLFHELLHVAGSRYYECDNYALFTSGFYMEMYDKQKNQIFRFGYGLNELMNLYALDNYLGVPDIGIIDEIKPLLQAFERLVGQEHLGIITTGKPHLMFNLLCSSYEACDVLKIYELFDNLYVINHYLHFKQITATERRDATREIVETGAVLMADLDAAYKKKALHKAKRRELREAEMDALLRDIKRGRS